MTLTSIRPGDDECSITEPLVVDQKYGVRIEMRQRVVEVYIDGVLRCSEKRADRRAFKSAHVYGSDPFYTAAHGTLDNRRKR